MIARSLRVRFFFHFAVVIILMGISTAAYSRGGSVLRIVPKGTLVCLQFENLEDIDWKIASLVNSLNIPDVPPVSIGQLVGKMTGKGIESLKDLENAGFNMRGDVCIFLPGLSLNKISGAVHVTSRKQAEEIVRQEIGGTDKQHRGVTYAASDGQAAWVFLDDVFVYSKDETVIMDAINTHLREKLSILQDERYLASIGELRTGDFSGYVALDEITSTFLPLLRAQAEKVKKEIPEQMKQAEQQNANMPSMAFDTAKILGAEIDMGLWILQQVRSYSISLGMGEDSIWMNDSLKFRPNSPICDYLKVKPGRLELVEYLPGDVMIAGGAKIDSAGIKKLNSVIMGAFLPALKEKITTRDIEKLLRQYETVTHEILSCFGDEVAFAIPAKSDRMMPRLIYLFKVADENKARKTICNVEYIMEMSRPFYEAFGMSFQMSEGPTQRYNGIQIDSFQMDLSNMAHLAPNAGAMYPENQFIWYAFVDNKMIYTMSQSSDTIKTAIDAVKGRRSCIAHSTGFGDIDICLPERRNATVYVSPAGYLNFVMGMVMSQMGQSMPPGGSMAGTMKPSIGFAVATNLNGDGISNFNYLLVDEIRELVGTVLSFGQMMKTQQQQQMMRMQR